MLFLCTVRDRKYVSRTLNTVTYLAPINTTVALYREVASSYLSDAPGSLIV